MESAFLAPSDFFCLHAGWVQSGYDDRGVGGEGRERGTRRKEEGGHPRLHSARSAEQYLLSLCDTIAAVRMFVHAAPPSRAGAFPLLPIQLASWMEGNNGKFLKMM